MSVQIKTRNATTGGTKIVKSVTTSAGAADSGKIPETGAAGTLDNSFINVAAGTGLAADAAKVVVTGADGKVPEAALPTSVGAGTKTYVSSEALTAGNVVDIYLDSGTAKVRKAMGSTTGKLADGYVLAAVASGGTATVYTRGENNQVTGLTIGELVYLSTATAGAVQQTVPSGAGCVQQCVGVAKSATAFDFIFSDGEELAE